VGSVTLHVTQGLLCHIVKEDTVKHIVSLLVNQVLNSFLWIVNNIAVTNVLLGGFVMGRISSIVPRGCTPPLAVASTRTVPEARIIICLVVLHSRQKCFFHLHKFQSHL
jgi:hypothetical protein